MSVITTSKGFDEVWALLAQRGDLRTAVVGCDKCAKTSRTGGTAEVRAIRERLRAGNMLLVDAPALVDAVEEGLCDPKAVPERLAPLSSMLSEIQLLVLSCGAGLKCVMDTLPGVRIVPGLNTLGPGVKDQLACLSCGDCSFGTAGCKMLGITRRQADRLAASYCTPESAHGAE